MSWEPGWDIGSYAEAYRAGASVRDVIGAVLEALTAAPTGVLIGEPLREPALEQAGTLELRGSDGLPLYGVPFLVKDNIDVGGAPTTAGCPGFEYIAAGDATVVARLRAAGAIPVGKANLDQFATGLVGTRSPFGLPPNVLRADLVPGGSSSGSAVGVALGLVPFALGTDTAGSGRVPAALNGIVGWKPSVGRASGRGVVPAVRRFDCPSVFARTVADARRAAEAMSGPDDDEPYSRTSFPMASSPTRRLGIPAAWPEGTAPDADVLGWFEEALERLADQGYELVPVGLEPFFAAGDLLYGGPLVAERYVAVGDAVAAGLVGLHPVVSGIIEQADKWSAADAYRAEYQLAEFRRAVDPVMQRLDALVLPATPTLLTIADAITEPVTANMRLGRYTTFANLLDLAALVVPIRTDGVAVPAGLQFLGVAGSEDLLAGLGAEFIGESFTPTTSAHRVDVVVVGAHLSGQPLNHQLTDLGGEFVRATTTSADYLLYRLRGGPPLKPGLVRSATGGGAIEVEVWSLDPDSFGRFVQQVSFPLAIGPIELADGTWQAGFVAQPAAVVGADDITAVGGWRAYLATQLHA